MPFWPFKKRKPKEEDALHSLSDIARGMQHAVNSTQEMAEQHFGRMIERYFNDDGTPITKKFVLPDEHYMEVPLIALVPPSGLILKEMFIQMAIRVDNMQVKKAGPHDEDHHLTRSSFSVSFSPRKGQGSSGKSNVIDVEMKFVAGEAPEGVQRVLEAYSNTMMVPKPVGKVEMGKKDTGKTEGETGDTTPPAPDEPKG